MRELKSVILKCYLLEISKGSLKVEEEFVCINTCVCTSWEQSSWLRLLSSVQFGQLLSRVQLIETPWTAARQASLSVTNSQSLLKHMSIELVMPSNHLILCRSLLLLPSIFPSIRAFSNESVLRIRGPKDWSFSFISPSNEYSGLISFRVAWLISLQSKGLSRVFSTTIQKHQFFSAQLSLESNSHIHA